MNTKFLAAIGSAIISFLLSAPADLHRTAGVALWFLILDTFTGYLCARQNGTHTSSAFRLKLRSKLGCYAGIIGFTAGLGVIAGSWQWVIAGFWGVMAAEGLSIKENITGMIATSSAAMAPIAALLEKINAFLTAGKGGSTLDAANDSSDRPETGA